MNKYQPKEQAGFRRNYITNTHLLKIRVLVKQSTEYNFEISLAFVDSQKAFYTFKHTGQLLIHLRMQKLTNDI